MIVKYIIEVLKKEDSVFVNELGLFKKIFVSAKITQNFIEPPQNKIELDPDYDGNGFAFTLFVSQNAQIRIMDADESIGTWVSDLKTAIENNKSIHFENFGVFSKNSNGTIFFECDPVLDLNREFEGMVNIDIQSQLNEEIKKEPIFEKPEPITEIPHVVIDITENKTEEFEQPIDNKENRTTDIPFYPIPQEPVMEISEEKNSYTTDSSNFPFETTEPAFNKKEENKTKFSDNLFFILVILISLISLVLLFKDNFIQYYQDYQLKNNQIKHLDNLHLGEEDLNIYEKEIPIEEEVIETPASNAAPITSSVEQSNQQETANQINDIQQIKFEEGKFYVIIGSFPNHQQAIKHIQERKMQKYNPQLLQQDHVRNIRICAGIFNSEAEANTHGKTLGINYWVLK
ncbi:MAG: hypothetical protein RR356_04320 [Bacteroidales bacterium]